MFGYFRELRDERVLLQMVEAKALEREEGADDERPLLVLDPRQQAHVGVQTLRRGALDVEGVATEQSPELRHRVAEQLILDRVVPIDVDDDEGPLTLRVQGSEPDLFVEVCADRARRQRPFRVPSPLRCSEVALAPVRDGGRGSRADPP